MEEKSFSEFFESNKEEILQEETLNEINTHSGGSSGEGTKKAIAGLFGKAKSMYGRYRSKTPYKLTDKDVQETIGYFEIVGKETYYAILDKVTNEYKKDNGKSGLIKYIQDGMLTNPKDGVKYFAMPSAGQKIYDIVKKKNPTIAKYPFDAGISKEDLDSITSAAQEKKDKSIGGKISKSVGGALSAVGKKLGIISASCDYDGDMIADYFMPTNIDMMIDSLNFNEYMTIFETKPVKNYITETSGGPGPDSQTSGDPGHDPQPSTSATEAMRVVDVAVYTLNTDLDFGPIKFGGKPKWYLIVYAIMKGGKVTKSFYSFSANKAGADILEELMGTNFKNSMILFTKEGERRSGAGRNLTKDEMTSLMKRKRELGVRDNPAVKAKVANKTKEEILQLTNNIEATKIFANLEYLFKNYQDGKFDVNVGDLYTNLEKLITNQPNLFMDDSDPKDVKPAIISNKVKTLDIKNWPDFKKWLEERFAKGDDINAVEELESVFLYIYGTLKEMAREVSGWNEITKK